MEVKIKNPQELQKLHRLLNGKQLKEVISKAVKRAAEDYVENVHEFIDAGKTFTPRTGFLQQSIGWRPLSKFRAKVFVNAKYASFVEYGTQPHVIKPKKRKALRWEEEGQQFFAKKVFHPGNKPYPFFFADFEARAKSAQQEFIEEIREFLEDG